MSEDFNQRGTVRDRCSSLVFASIASFTQFWISCGLWAIGLWQWFHERSPISSCNRRCQKLKFS
ncbi:MULTISPECIES: hypothetical protein [Planktothricoides]|uniref:Uncharacterized protein n=2 Tax=Planktothricoides raciborskii TaxID=132608 RepID=A0AAU8J8T4_9CYAN|nr:MULTISPECIES: hypothetical protein [Planktothricoides]MBD2545523.1 hypothetical protein [Planktothricoides raciborskii FACHB-1370]MBD2583428.1 hypothetical protein [Planktothricoides raciborskii FACHB-1261]